MDLSRLDQRTTQQGRVTRNRDGTLPRRNTEAPERRIYADMRNAVRGDVGGAEELKKLFGVVDRAADSLQGYVDAKHQRDELASEADGFLDAATGQVDPEQAERSRAYRKAMSLGNAQRSWLENRAQMQGEVDALLNDPNNPPDLHDVHEYLEDAFKKFATIDGKLRDFGSPEATLSVGQEMAKARAEIMSHALAVITEQTNAKSVENSVGILTGRLQNGEALDFEGALTTLTPGVPLPEAKKLLTTAALDYAASTQEADPKRALAVVDQLLASKRANGHASLSVPELDRVRTERKQIAHEIKVATNRAEAELQEANSDKLMDRLNRVPGSGSYPTRGEILAMRQKNELSAEGSTQLLNWIDADVREAQVASRSRSGGGRDSGAEGDLTPAGYDVVSRVLRGEMSYGEASSTLLRWGAEGRFGTGNQRKKAMTAIRTELSGIAGSNRSVFQEADGDLKSFVSRTETRLNRLPRHQREKARLLLRSLSDRATVTMQQRGRTSGADFNGMSERAQRQIWSEMTTRYPSIRN